jgi:hypothetical protein
MWNKYFYGKAIGSPLVYFLPQANARVSSKNPEQKITTDKNLQVQQTRLSLKEALFIEALPHKMLQRQ